MLVYDMWGTCFLYCVNFDSFSFFFYVVHMWSLPVQWIRLSGHGKYQRESKTEGDRVVITWDTVSQEASWRKWYLSWDTNIGLTQTHEYWEKGVPCRENLTSVKALRQVQVWKSHWCLRKVIGVQEEQLETGSEDNEVTLPRRINGNAKWGSTAGQHETPGLPKTSAWEKVTRSAMSTEQSSLDLKIICAFAFNVSSSLANLLIFHQPKPDWLTCYKVQEGSRSESTPETWVGVLLLSLTTCRTFDKYFYISRPQSVKW